MLGDSDNRNTNGCLKTPKKKKKTNTPKKMKLRDMAVKATMKVCCRKLCLTKCEEKVEDCIPLVEAYMRPYYFMGRRELKKNFRAKLEAMTTGISFGGDRQGQLSIKLQNERSIDVCPAAYTALHCRGHTFYDEVSTSV